MAEEIVFYGNSGAKYKYYLCSLDERFLEVPANYVFIEKTESGFIPIFIGQTEHMNQSFSLHKKWPCIRSNGATHICTHQGNPSKEGRCEEEADMIKYYDPICNKKLVT